ncbi:hypothetical protein NM688_g564 [Phlebia brevispora]|uniref:Uncharacterized protein n=1 Tax=Phlebia brevispora TaxID=194682 RepID=A0ACC1TDZ3_9APHY|nr:hypothetical protein NM688_g564 [Phlebia brevispora]
MTVAADSDSVQCTNGNVEGKASNGLAKTLSEEYYLSRLSVMAKNRTHDEIRSCLHLEQRPGLISMLAGKPHTSTFPFTSLNFTFRDPADPASELPVSLSQEELELGLQYSPTVGIPALVEWCYGLQEIAHGRRKGEGWKLSIGNGSQDLIYKAVTALVNPGDSKHELSERVSGTTPMFQTLQCDIVEVETDAHGIRSDSLRHILENWPASKPKPKVLYTVPYGSNPTGATATLDRRLEVLALAREHEFFILEDDPYHFLYYGPMPRPPSYFALERDQPQTGWVIRFDSLSKVLSSGIRVGFVSGPEVIVQAMNDHSTVANLQPNSLAQVLALSLLSRWGYQGFLEHTAHVAEFYKKKRDAFQAAMLRHLSGIAEWSMPEAGMFMWFKLLIDTDDGAEGDSNSVIRTTALERGVLALPGHRVLSERAEVRIRARVVQPTRGEGRGRGVAEAERGHIGQPTRCIGEFSYVMRGFGQLWF